MSWSHSYKSTIVGTIGGTGAHVYGILNTKRNDNGTLDAYCTIDRGQNSPYAIGSTMDVWIGDHAYNNIPLTEGSGSSTYTRYTSDHFTIDAGLGYGQSVINMSVETSSGSISGAASTGLNRVLDAWVSYSVNGVDAETGNSATIKLGRTNTITITNSRGLGSSAQAANYTFVFKFAYESRRTSIGSNQLEVVDSVECTGAQTSITWTPTEAVWGEHMNETIRVSLDIYYYRSVYSSVFKAVPTISTSSSFDTALQTIPRTPTDPSTIFAHIKNPSNVQDAATVGSANTIVISASEYTYTVQLLRNNTVVATPVSGSTSLSHSYTPPIATWGPQITDALSGTITVRLLMYDGSTLVGSTDTTATMTIPANLVQPACSIATSDDAGYLSTYGGYVLGQSKIKVTATNTLRYGATLASILITANGSSYTYNNCVTDVIASLSYTQVTCQITDSRGQTASASATITIVNWFTPIPSLSVHRGTYSGGVFTPDDNGGYVKIDWEITIAPVNNHNTKAGSVSAPDGNHTLTLSSYTASGSIISAANTEYSYDITVTATDAFESASRTTRLSTAGVIMDFKSGGKGVAFGKVAETDNMVEISSNWTLKAYNIMIGNQTLAQYIQSIVGS